MAVQGVLPRDRPPGQAVRAVPRSNGRWRQQGQPNGDIKGDLTTVLEVDAMTIEIHKDKC